MTNWFDRPVYDDIDAEARMDVPRDDYEPAGDRDGQFPADIRRGKCHSTGEGWEPCDRTAGHDGEHWCSNYGRAWAAKWDDDGHYERRQIADLMEGKTA